MGSPISYGITSESAHYPYDYWYESKRDILVDDFVRELYPNMTETHVPDGYFDLMEHIAELDTRYKERAGSWLPKEVLREEVLKALVESER